MKENASVAYFANNSQLMYGQIYQIDTHERCCAPEECGRRGPHQKLDACSVSTVYRETQDAMHRTYCGCNDEKIVPPEFEPTDSPRK